MAFSFTIDNNGVSEFFGRKKFVQGTLTNTVSAATGTVSTGLKKIDKFVVYANAASDTSPGAVYPRVASFPVESGDVSVRAQAALTASWFAIGE